MKGDRVVLAAVLASVIQARADNPGLFDLSLEELGQIRVTSVSKKEERIFKSSAAVYVVTQDDIHRSGATSIPEALRFVPGLQVARFDGNKWAITARGFSSLFANKLLVLVDGRNVYNPVFAGAWWDVQDTLLEDIERIEVIRGPGSTLWGNNAVNGIINIITKHSQDTQGGLLSAGAGTEERGIVGLRYGGKFGADGYYRVFAKYLRRDDQRRADQGAGDGTEMGRGGFRIDQEIGRDSFMLQAEGYRGSSQGARFPIASLSPPFSAALHDDLEPSGAFLLGRWRHRGSETSATTLQLYYDYTDRDFPALGFRARSDLFDFEFQHDLKLGERHDIVWGGGYRLAWSRFANGFPAGMSRDDRRDQLVNLFVQDDIWLAPERLRLTLGTKVEHNDFTGFEVQPNIRIAWTPGDEYTVWASIARSVRIFSIAANNLVANTRVLPPTTRMPLPTVLGVRGSDNTRAEELLAYELGFRGQPTPRFSWDLALFYHDFEKLQGLASTPCTLQSTAGTPHLLCTLNVNNGFEGEVYGLELSVDWRIHDHWRLQGGYTLMRVDQRVATPGTVASFTPEGADPGHQIFLRSSVDLPHHVYFDLGLRFVDELPAYAVGSYFTADARMAWRPFMDLEIALIGKNLAENSHIEYTSQLFFNPTEVERSVFGLLTWRF